MASIPSYLLGASIEKIKVPKLESDPLSRLPNELVRTIQCLWVGSRIRRREQFFASVPEKKKETFSGRYNWLRPCVNFLHPRHSDSVLKEPDDFHQIIFVFSKSSLTSRGTCFHVLQSCKVDFCPQRGPLAPRSLWTALHKIVLESVQRKIKIIVKYF